MNRTPLKEDPDKIYINVAVEFTPEGQMIPTSLIWGNRKHKIDRLIHVHPSVALKSSGEGDRYDVMVGGQNRSIWFEHNEDISDKCVGRWFVERKRQIIPHK